MNLKLTAKYSRLESNTHYTTIQCKFMLGLTVIKFINILHDYIVRKILTNTVPNRAVDIFCSVTPVMPQCLQSRWLWSLHVSLQGWQIQTLNVLLLPYYLRSQNLVKDLNFSYFLNSDNNQDMDMLSMYHGRVQLLAGF